MKRNDLAKKSAGDEHASRRMRTGIEGATTAGSRATSIFDGEAIAAAAAVRRQNRANPFPSSARKRHASRAPE